MCPLHSLAPIFSFDLPLDLRPAFAEIINTRYFTMEAQLINTPQAGFPFFSSLPQELRDQIWETAVTPPQNGVNYFSVHHSSTTGVASNCVEVDPRYELPTQRGPRLLPPSFDPNNTTPLTRSWFNGNPSTYNLPRIAFACREARNAFIRVVKLSNNAPVQTTSASAPASSSAHSQRTFTAFPMKQDSERVRQYIRLSQDLVYLKINGNALPSDDDLLYNREPHLDPLSLLRNRHGHPKNIAIELAPNFPFFAKLDSERRLLALFVLINSWLNLGIGVWIVNRLKKSEQTILDKAYTSRATVFCDTNHRSYITIPMIIDDVYICDLKNCHHDVAELADYIRCYIAIYCSTEETSERRSRFGLLFPQENLKFC